jgi:hypothetical protein
VIDHEDRGTYHELYYGESSCVSAGDIVAACMSLTGGNLSHYDGHWGSCNWGLDSTASCYGYIWTSDIWTKYRRYKYEFEQWVILGDVWLQGNFTS